MRVAVVTESFLPQVNGVTNSVLRVCDHLRADGHEVLVIAPGRGPAEHEGIPVVRTPSIPTPGYADFGLARPWPGLKSELRGFAPDVVHLASPAVLGAQAAWDAHRLGLPIVAIYQTDLAGFAARYGLPGAERAVWGWLRKVHGFADRTLAPSRSAVEDLHRNGIRRVARWMRGVDLDRFHPSRRSRQHRLDLAPDGRTIVGYVGRLAHEKQLELLAPLGARADVQLVLAGDGPLRERLQRLLPRARFLGFQAGTALAETLASFDVFVHPGAHETFCQSAQEALASGVPVVGPRAGGLRDLVEPDRTGLLFAPDDAADLARQVGALVDDPARRAALAAATRSSVAGRSWDVIGRQLVDHYRQVRAGPPCPVEPRRDRV